MFRILVAALAAVWLAAPAGASTLSLEMRSTYDVPGDCSPAECTEPFLLQTNFRLQTFVERDRGASWSGTFTAVLFLKDEQITATGTGAGSWSYDTDFYYGCCSQSHLFFEMTGNTASGDGFEMSVHALNYYPFGSSPPFPDNKRESFSYWGESQESSWVAWITQEGSRRGIGHQFEQIRLDVDPNIIPLPAGGPLLISAFLFFGLRVRPFRLRDQ